MVQSIQIISRLPKLTRIDDPLVTFSEEDAWWLHYPHDNALVITLLITNFTTWRVLIDNGSSVDILYYPTFQQTRIDKEQLYRQTHHS